MKQWTTEIMAQDPESGEMKRWLGPRVPGVSMTDAQAWCQHNRLGYCRVVGMFVAEVKLKASNAVPLFETYDSALN